MHINYSGLELILTGLIIYIRQSYPECRGRIYQPTFWFQIWSVSRTEFYQKCLMRLTRTEPSVGTDETWSGHYSASFLSRVSGFFFFPNLWTRLWYLNSKQQRPILRTPTPPRLLPPAARLSFLIKPIKAQKTSNGLIWLRKEPLPVST